MSKHKRPVRIDNPVSKPYTSHRKATEYVREGRAEWTNPGRNIRFVESDHRHRSAVQTASTISGVATLNQIAGIPVIHPDKLIAPTAPKRWWSEHSVDRSTDRQRTHAASRTASVS